MKIKFPSLKMPNYSLPKASSGSSKVKNVIQKVKGKNPTTNSGMLDKIKDKCPESIKQYIPNSVSGIGSDFNIGALMDQKSLDVDGLMSKGVNMSDVTKMFSGDMSFDIDSSISGYLPSDIDDDMFNFT